MFSLSTTTSSLLLGCLVTLTAAQYFYVPVMQQPSSYTSSEDLSSSPSSGEYIELVRVPRALRHGAPPPSLIPSSPLPPRVGAPGGIPLPAIRHHQPYRGVNNNNHQQQQYPGMMMYEPMATSASKRDPLVTSESHGHAHHHGHDYVDYGAYTGGWGAFGWYSDHPVHAAGH